MPLGSALCDVVASLWASTGILSAYTHRLKTGQGQHVDMSLVEAGVSLMFSPVAMHDHVEREKSTQSSRTDGNAPSGFFMTSDGSYVTVFASYPALWDRFVKAMHLEHLAEDARFKSRDKRTANAGDLHRILAEIFLTAPTEHWVDLLVGAGVPAARVNDVAHMVQDPQIIARNMIVEQEHPTAGKIRVVGVPVKLSETPGGVRTPAPLIGQHTDEVIGGLGHGERLAALREQGVI